MRISDISASNYSEYMKLFSGNKNIKQPSTQLSDKMSDTKKNVDPSAYIEPGMDITGRSDWKKIVDVSEEIKDKVINIMRKDFINNFGMTDGEEFRDAQVKYIKSLPASERASVAWTLDRIFGEEGARLGNIVKEKVPVWQPGQPFDRSILADVISGSSIDKKV